MSSSKAEFLRQCDALDIAAGLKRREPVIYHQNGSRSSKPGRLLRQVQKLAPQIGITRVSDISHLSPINFPVFQSARPNLYGHYRMGQNSGGQGKGWTKAQAKLSCLMESLESFCMEPRQSHLIRNSRQYLKVAQFVPKFRGLNRNLNGFTPRDNEQLMWTEALDFWLGQKILIPAELVYFPFNTSDYKTRSIFAQGSNGLASGSTYLEACLHSLYECIERHYWSIQLSNRANIEAIFECDFDRNHAMKIERRTFGEMCLQVYSVRFDRWKNLNIPTLFAVLVGRDHHFFGMGCNLNPKVAYQRAVSEAHQTYATWLSGAREDQHKGGTVKNEFKFRQPNRRTMTLKRLKSKTVQFRASSLKQEFDFLTSWLRGRGFTRIYFANLTRVGIDVPVVKAIVPGLELPRVFKKPINWRVAEKEALAFRLGETHEN